MNRVVTLAVLLLAPAIALADERPYAFTYEPVVSAGGEMELEAYETLYQPKEGGIDAATWEHKLEVGYGVTDRLALSTYFVFRTTSSAAFEASALKLEGRYKLLDAGASPVDLVLYLELEKEVVDDKPWGIEEKVILGRSYGHVSWALNLVAEQEWPAAGGTELKLGYSAGVAAAVGGGVKLGVESFGWRTREVDGAIERTAYAGPTGSVALPFMTRLGFNSSWLVLGASFGLTDASDKFQARAILGADF
jgi:hypothetical protein